MHRNITGDIHVDWQVTAVCDTRGPVDQIQSRERPGGCDKDLCSSIAARIATVGSRCRGMLGNVTKNFSY